jgi:ethanolamine utilization protein EutQ
MEPEQIIRDCNVETVDSTIGNLFIGADRAVPRHRRFTLNSLALSQSGSPSSRFPVTLFVENKNYPMPTLISQPTRITAAGNKPKLIDEYVGRVNTKTSAASVAHMRSPAGWIEPGQTPEFDEFTIVLKGMVRVEHQGGTFDVNAGQAVVTHAGEWVRYSTPKEGGAEYIAVCLPAFSMETVHRDE